MTTEQQETAPARKPGPNTVVAAQPRDESGVWVHANEHRKLTEFQARFVTEYVANGGNGAEAARKAGYSLETSAGAGYRLLSLPWVQRAVEVARGRCLAELEVKSLRVLRGILEETNPLSVGQQLKAAEIVLKIRAGDRALDKKTEQSKALNEMSVDELEAFIRRGREAAAQAQAPIIEGRSEPVTNGDDSQPIDPAANNTA